MGLVLVKCVDFIFWSTWSTGAQFPRARAFAWARLALRRLKNLVKFLLNFFGGLVGSFRAPRLHLGRIDRLGRSLNQREQVALIKIFWKKIL